MKQLLLLCAAATIFALAAVTSAQAAMQVLDSTNLAKNAQIATTSNRILSINNQTLQILQQILESTGLSGGYGSSGLGGLLKDGTGVTGLTGGSATMGEARSMLDMLYKAVSLGQDVSEGRPVDFNQALNLFQDAFRTYDEMDIAARQTVHQEALRFYNQSVDDAAALAVVNRETAATGGQRIKKLMNQAREAKNTNERLGVISAQLSVLTDEMIQLRALMAGFVQAEMGEKIRHTPHAGGDVASKPTLKGKQQLPGTSLFD